VFRQLIHALFAYEARYLGRVSLIRGGGARSSAVEFDERVQDVELTLEAFREALDDPDVRVLSTEFEDAAGTGSKDGDVVSYLRSTNPLRDQHALAIWTSCDEIEWAWNLQAVDVGDRDRVASRATEIESAALERFCGLVTKLEPTYAAVTVEANLPGLIELRDHVQAAAAEPGGQAPRWRAWGQVETWFGNEFAVRLTSLDAGARLAIEHACSSYAVRECGACLLFLPPRDLRRSERLRVARTVVGEILRCLRDAPKLSDG
jgi:hypothetical protein